MLQVVPLQESVAKRVPFPKPIEQIVKSAQLQVCNTREMGPRNAIRELSFNAASDDDKVQWVQKARLASILGSVSRSLNSTASGVRCWMHFASQILKLKGRELPPSVDGLLAFSCLFRNAETYGNYLAHIRLACELLQVSTQTLDDRSIKRAKKAIRSRAHFTRRAPMFIGVDLVRQILRYANRFPHWQPNAFLYLTAYAFLLRLPSEALPIVRGCSGSPDYAKLQAVINIDGANKSMSLTLARRKNKPGGSVLTRYCWCDSDPETCPVCILGPFFQQQPLGVKIFKEFIAKKALSELKMLFALLEVPNYEQYRCHDLRRGHARDLQLKGAGLAEILDAGQWSSPAFLKYLDVHALEASAVLEAHMDESSDDENLL